MNGQTMELQFEIKYGKHTWIPEKLLYDYIVRNPEHNPIINPLHEINFSPPFISHLDFSLIRFKVC
uniref:Uncharacterized protein n=1 Tax=Romanomermis culicivorax TaxID=13658 RepID=A0A915IAM5_ROMCU